MRRIYPKSSEYNGHAEFIVPISDFVGVYIVSPDYQATYRDPIELKGWIACEKEYGINPAVGSKDPDPVRELAFKILKGDPIARDIATHVLQGGL